MSLISLKNVSKSFYGTTLFDGINLNIDPEVRLALIGDNGVGKTTLLRIIANLESIDEGSIIRSRNLRIGYLDQNLKDEDLESKTWESQEWLDAKAKLEQAMIVLADAANHNQALADYQNALQHFEALGGYNYEYALRSALAGLGLPDDISSRELKTCSGGEKMRITLAKLLLSKPDLLLLDEPTNHLDLPAIDWLANYLQSYKGTIVIISHDRYFLNQMATACAFLSSQSLRVFDGNFDKAYAQKEESDAFILQQTQELEKELIHQKEVTQTFLSHRNISGYHSRQKVVKKLSDQLAELKRKNYSHNQKLRFNIMPMPSDGDPERIIFEVNDLEYKLNDRLLFTGLNWQIKAKDKIIILGPNGSGKTTLIKILMGEISGFSAKIKYADNLSIAYMSQMIEFPNEGRSIIDTFLEFSDKTLADARNHLANFGFYDINVFKSTDVLSGGERARLYLACILESNPQLLCLDEPTNHLDINSRTILETALTKYQGAIIAVSHDRYFIEKFANRFYSLENHHLQSFYSIDKALARQIKVQNDYTDAAKQSKSTNNSAVNIDNHKLKNIRNKDLSLSPAKRRQQIANLQKQVKDFEDKITQIETDIATLEAGFNAESHLDDYHLLADLMNQQEQLWIDYAQVQNELDELSTKN